MTSKQPIRGVQWRVVRQPWQQRPTISTRRGVEELEVEEKVQKERSSEKLLETTSVSNAVRRTTGSPLKLSFCTLCGASAHIEKTCFNKENGVATGGRVTEKNAAEVVDKQVKEAEVKFGSLAVDLLGPH